MHRVSTFLYTYSVPLERLRRIPGSRDRQLVDQIVAVSDEAISRTDEAMNEAFDDEVIPRFMSCGHAIRQIVDGEPLDEELGVIYAHAYELICEALATDCRGQWGPISSSTAYFECLDRALEHVDVPLRCSDLMCTRSIISMPRPDDFPSLGWWSPETIAASYRPLQKLRSPLRRLMRMGRRLDVELAEALPDIEAWIGDAYHHPGYCIVGVLHF